jgi:hypothetical protein
MPVRRSAPVKVVVFQWPCGTPARHRSPRGGAAAQASHLGGQAALVDEDKLRRVEVGLALEPVAAPLQDIRTLLLQCMCGLFLNVQPRLRNQVLSALRPMLRARSAFSRATISLSVMSLAASIMATTKAS